MLTNFVLFVFIVIFTIMLIFYIVNENKHNIIHKYVTKMVNISSIFIPVGIYLTYRVFHLQFETMNITSTYAIIDRGWLHVNQKFTEYYDECPNFIDSLYFNWQQKVIGKNKGNNMSNTADKWMTVNYLSILIFQAWEDFITSVNVDDTGSIVWICNFLQWSNSKILKANWSVLKTNYSKTTQNFGDYLFYMSSMHNINNPEELNVVAESVKNSDIFKDIISERFPYLSLFGF